MKFMRTLVLMCAVCMMSFFLDNQANAKDCASPDSYSKKSYCRPQCVDYVACKIGISSYGNAYKWWDSPPSGYKNRDQGGKKAPQKHDILVWKKGAFGSTYGHVAYIEKVDTKKKKITISQTNMNNKCGYSEEKLSYKVKKNKYTVDSDKLYGWLSK